MRKKSLVVTICLLFALSIAVIPALAATPSIILNGQALQCDTPPVIEDGNTLVPMRAIFEGLGAQVAWDGPTKTVTAATYDTTVKLTIGGDIMVNGQKLDTTVQAKIYNSTTMVPLAVVSESLGANVEWNQDTQTVTITTTTPACVGFALDMFNTQTVTITTTTTETETPDDVIVDVEEEVTETETTGNADVNTGEETAETDTTGDADVDTEEENTETETTGDADVDTGEETAETETTGDADVNTGEETAETN